MERTVTEPPTGNVVIGPREGFVEDIATNMELIKKRVKHKDLTFKKLTVGRYTQTEVQIVYIKSIADKKIADEIADRISRIDIDGIIDSSYIAEYLNTHKLSIFKAVSTDEKPDIVTAKLLEGRVSVIVDGSPIVLSAPYLLLEDLQNSNDYYSNNSTVTLKRVIRLFGGLIAALLPAFYLAIELYHMQIIPTNTLLSIIPSSGNSLFAPMAEMIFVLVLFEIIYEATISMPKNLGTATSLVGALVLGDIAATVGLISAPVVLVAAISGITMYILPDLVPQIGFLRLFLCVAAGVFGLYGVVTCAVLLIVYMAGLDSYGTPLLAPFAPFIPEDQKDAITKSPLPEMTTRPKSIPNINKVRSKAVKDDK